MSSSGQPTISINIFTYTEDATLVLGNIDILRIVLPDAKIHVIDDFEKPLPGNIVKAIRSRKGVIYEVSTFRRNGNLNGKECILGILMTLAKNAVGRNGVSIKLDCDTVIVGRKWIDEFIKKEAYYTASPRTCDACFAGLCYGIHNKFLPSIIHIADTLPIRDDAPEDVTIGALALLLAPNDKYIIQPHFSKKNPDGRWVAWAWHSEPLSEKRAWEMIHKFDVITLGNNRFDKLFQFEHKTVLALLQHAIKLKLTTSEA